VTDWFHIHCKRIAMCFTGHWTMKCFENYIYNLQGHYIALCVKNVNVIAINMSKMTSHGAVTEQVKEWKKESEIERRERERRDGVLRWEQKVERYGSAVTCDGRLARTIFWYWFTGLFTVFETNTICLWISFWTPSHLVRNAMTSMSYYVYNVSYDTVAYCLRNIVIEHE